MKKVIVPLNAFDRNEVLEKGQAAFVEIIAQSGAYGIEIRRELFQEGDLPLKELRDKIEFNQLFTVYSAPIELWNEDYSINKDRIQGVYKEAALLGAKWLKVSLGHYHSEQSDCAELKHFLTKLANEYADINLLVENDQTLYGGNVDQLKAFFENAYLNRVPVTMTFDTGNWYYSKQDVHYAIMQLADYVEYLHFKHVEVFEDRLQTLPLPVDLTAEWRQILKQFPVHLAKALEFPIDPISESEISKYIEMVQTAVQEESEDLACQN